MPVVRRWWLSIAAVVVLLAGCSTATGADSWPADPAGLAAGHWTTVPSAPLSARHDPVSAWVGDRFVVVGGRTEQPCPDTGSCAGPLRAAERDGASFEPSTGKWTAIAEAPTSLSADSPQGTNAVVVAGDLYVLVAGTAHDQAAFLRYGPAADRWTRLALPADHSATVVAGKDEVFAVPNGSDGGRVRVQEFAAGQDSGSWHTLPADPLGKADFRQATWFDGRLMLAGPPLATNPGSAGADVRITWWNPDTDTWSKPVTGKVTGDDPTTVGSRIVWPGNGAGRTSTSGGILDPAAEHWSKLPSPLDRDGLDRASGLVAGSRIVVGDPAASPAGGRGQLLDPASREWTAIPPLPGPDRFGSALAASGDDILVWGGGTATENLADGYLLRLP